jgi:ketosteroid isomerase-like protein
MPASSQPDRLIADLNDLLQLDHDAVQAYTLAIDVVRDARYRERLVEYRGDHKRHIEELAAVVRAHGGLPVELPHATAPLKLAVQALGAAPGDATLLLAFKAVEGQARDKYHRASHASLPDDALAVVQRAAADEDRHYAWVEQVLREQGVGSGTLPHGIASAVEGLHKLLADPIEGVERQIMQAVGNLVGTSRQRTGGAAPSPIDAMTQGMAAGGSGGGATADEDAAEWEGDALRFAAALHALEETGDVERMVMLFDDTAEVSGPTDAAPHRGRDGARKFWRMYRDSFGEIHSEFEKIVEGRDGTVMLEWTSRGVTATGSPVTYRGVSVAEIPDGRVTRFRTYFDTRELEIGTADLH